MADTGFNSAVFNMDLDESLFRNALENPDASPVLRVYGFHRPAITYGYSQKISSHWLEDPFYESAKRVTGGGLVFHGKDLTYSVVAGYHHRQVFSSLCGSYRAFHEIVQRAFAKINIVVDFLEEKKSVSGAKNLCFLAPVKHDLLYQGKKIAGAAQKRSGGCFLHQGSVNFRAFLAEGLDRSVQAAARGQAKSGLAEPEDYRAFYEKYKEAFIASFREYFGVDFAQTQVPGQRERTLEAFSWTR